MIKNIFVLFCFLTFISVGIPLHSNAKSQKVFYYSIPYLQETIELHFDKEGNLNVKSAHSVITLVRLFNQDGEKIIIKGDESSKVLKVKNKLLSGSSWYVQIKTADGKSHLKKIKVP